VRRYTEDSIKKLFRDINQNLMRKFNGTFKKDEDGKPRNWVKMEKNEIDELWQKCKARCEDIFKEFKFIRLDWDIDVNLSGETPGGPDDQIV